MAVRRDQSVVATNQRQRRHERLLEQIDILESKEYFEPNQRILSLPVDVCELACILPRHAGLGREAAASSRRNTKTMCNTP